MVLVKILKRKDASSVVVAVVLAFIVSQLATSLTAELAARLSGVGDSQLFGAGGGWQVVYLQPVIWALLQILVLEVLAWIVVFVTSAAKKK